MVIKHGTDKTTLAARQKFKCRITHLLKQKIIEINMIYNDNLSGKLKILAKSVNIPIFYKMVRTVGDII